MLVARMKALRSVALLTLCISVGNSQSFAKNNRGEIASATVNAAQTSIELILTNGERRTVRPSTSGDTFDGPQLADDRNTVGWTVYRVDGASYPYPMALQLIRRGAQKRFMCDGGMPQAWRFEGNSRIVVDCAFPHGAVPGRRLLVEIRTARVLAKVALSGDGSPAPNAPEWAEIAP